MIFWIYVGITFFSNMWGRPSPAVRPGKARRQRLPPSSFRKSHGELTSCSPPLSIFQSAGGAQFRVRSSSPQGQQPLPPVAFPDGRPIWKSRKPSDFAATVSCDDAPDRRTRSVPMRANPYSSDCGPTRPDQLGRSRAWYPPASAEIGIHKRSRYPPSDPGLPARTTFRERACNAELFLANQIQLLQSLSGFSPPHRGDS